MIAERRNVNAKVDRNRKKKTYSLYTITIQCDYLYVLRLFPHYTQDTIFDFNFYGF